MWNFEHFFVNYFGRILSSWNFEFITLFLGNRVKNQGNCILQF